MKKRLFSLIFALLLLLSACDFSGSEDNQVNCYFYYPARDTRSSALYAQSVNLDPESLSPEEFLTRYLSAETPQEAGAVLPVTWSLTDAHLEGTVLHIAFTGASPLPIYRSISLSCLLQTLLQHPQVESLSVLTPGLGSPQLLSSEDILLKDTGMEPQEAQVTLYFPDAQRRYLISQTQTVAQGYSTKQAEFILQELLSQSERGCIPSGTELLSVSVEGGVCTVDLSSAFEQNMASDFASQRMALYAIVNSLTELPEITTVDLWVAGAPLESLGLLDLRQGMARDESLISPPAGTAMADISLFPAVGKSGLLVEVPLSLAAAEADALAEAVLRALLDYTGKDGLKNPIPQGTKLLSLRMENTVCIVDLTGEFLAGCYSAEAETLAVRSVIATLCALDGISSVEILVEGLAPSYRDDSLSSLHRPQAGWKAE